MDERDRLITLLHQSQMEVEALLNRLDDAVLETVVYAESGWRVKDLVAHIIAWEQHSLRALQAYHEGYEYIIPGYVFGSSAHEDAFNAQVFAERYDWDKSDMMARWAGAHNGLKIWLAALDDNKLNGEMMCAWGARSTVSAMIADLVQHKRLHAEDIREAVSR